MTTAVRRIRFTSEDLLRTKIMPTVGRLGETLFALELLTRGGGGALYKRWRVDVRGRLPQRAQSLTTMAQCIRPVPDMLLLVGNDAGVADGVDRGPLASGDQRLGGAVQDFYRVAVAPYWLRAQSHLQTEWETRGRVLFSGGIEQLFATLHPQVKWEAPYLLVPNHSDQEIRLQNRGLLIAPSLFLIDKPRLFQFSDQGQPRLVLVYPAPPDPATSEALWNVSGEDGKLALGALVGRTRAEMLRVLADTWTSRDLGRRLGISSAAVSQHTSVLRRAGLIKSRRVANSVSHIVTPLGANLLRGPIAAGESVVSMACAERIPS